LAGGGCCPSPSDRPNPSARVALVAAQIPK
jgi:hypothetical protein